MKTIILYSSYHHHNTLKIVEAIAAVLDASIIETKQAQENSLDEYDLIGFASGIYYGKVAKNLLTYINSLPEQSGKAAFAIITSGSKKESYLQRLIMLLSKKGFSIKEGFSSLGYDTFGPLRLIGGINKNRPDAKDLENARLFGESLKNLKQNHS